MRLLGMTGDLRKAVAELLRRLLARCLVASFPLFAFSPISHFYRCVRSLVALSPLFTFLPFCLHPPTVLSQPSISSVDTLALIHGLPITSAEFKKRFELSVYPHKEAGPQLQAEKERFLFSMIAERLLADEASRAGLGFTPEARELERNATDTYMRDALYRKEILSRVSVTDGDITDGMKKAEYKYLIDAYYFTDESAADDFYGEAIHLNARRIDSLVSVRKIPSDTVTVVYGMVKKSQEDTFWGEPEGFVAKPVAGQGEYIVVRILKKYIDTPFTNLSLQEKENKIRKIIQSRYEMNRTEEYVDTTLGDVRVSMMKPLLSMLTDSISFELKNSRQSPYEIYLSLTQSEVDDLLEGFRSKWNDVIITLHHMDGIKKDTTLTVRDAIEGLVPAGFYCKDYSKEGVFAGLSATLQHYVEYVLLDQEAKSLGLADSKEVRSDVNDIMRAYLAGLDRVELTDTVKLGEAELDRFMTEYNASELKNIQLTIEKFTTRTIGEAVDGYNWLTASDGKDTLRSMIASVAMRGDTITSNAFLLGDIGAMFARLDPGQIYGPVKENDGYTICKLLSKKTAVPDSTFNLSVDTAKAIALYFRRMQVLYRHVASLAAKGDVKVFIEALKKTEVEPVQMFTVRKIGFGGEINAVPGLAVIEDWTRLAPMKDIVIP